MLLPPATHQAAGCLARRLSWITPHVASHNHLNRAKCSSHAGSSSIHASVSAAAAAVPAAAAAEQEQQNLPHVSVLLQEVLHNLNHMPIKVGACAAKAVAVPACHATRVCVLLRTGAEVSRTAAQTAGCPAPQRLLTVISTCDAFDHATVQCYKPVRA